MAHARPGTRRTRSGLIALLVGAGGCSGMIGDHTPPDPSHPDGGAVLPDGRVVEPDASPDGGDVVPFEPLSPAAYGTKVKNLLVGQPLSDAELRQLTANPGALPGLIDTWMAMPAWRDRMLVFFKQAFQQTQVNLADYESAVHFVATRVPARTQFMANMEEMFPRTVLALIDEGRPFTEVLTTRRFMVTPALASILSFVDTTPQDDDDRAMMPNWWVLSRYPSLTVTGVAGAVPVAQSIDPSSPNFMHWQVTAMPRFTTATGQRAVQAAMSFILGTGDVTAMAPALADTDWTSWRMVTIRAPRSGEAMSVFWDLPRMRTATELVHQTARVGFMTTPAFQANWPTNTSNQARVTTNQTMIVGLGTSFDDRGVTIPVMSDATDAMHAQPGTTCYACHITLDPMRDFFRQSFTYSYGPRINPAHDMIPTTGSFSVLGSTPVTGSGVAALADAMAHHPRFAVAWTQKLCRFANSVSCDEADPEFQRVATVFRDSNYNFRTLMRELLSSPLVTYAAHTQTVDTSGVGVSIARRDNLCFSLSNRLGLTDVCGIYGRNDVRARNLAMSVPGDGYARGAEEPLLPTDPDLFFASATENLCVQVAARVVDGPAPSRYASGNRAAALDDFVATVMGVPASDPRAARLRAVLSNHYDESVAAGQRPTDALRSVFVLACASPLAVTSGL